MPSSSFPSLAPNRRFARWGVPMAIALAGGLSAWLAWGWLHQVTHASTLSPIEHAPLQALQALLPGRQLLVPEQAGLWTTRLQGTDLLLARARPDGEAQVLNLCEQRMGQRHDPDIIYPMALRAGLTQAADATTARNPLVLASDKAQDLPTAALRGRAGLSLEDSHLELQLAGPLTSTWAVAFAEAAATPVAATAGQPQHYALRYRLRGELWLLWRPLSAGGAAALDGKAPGFQQAVRVRHVAMSGCAAGAVQWQAFVADATAKQALLWARAAPDPQLPLRTAVAAGSHRVPSAGPALVEDERLFSRLMAQGLLRPMSDGRLALASADALRGQTDANPQAAAALRAAYRSANGSYVRGQVRASNQARHWLAVRQALPDGPAKLPSGGDAMQATSQGELLTLSQGLPPIAARLFSRPLPGWSDWTRAHATQAWLTPALDAPATAGEPSTWLEWPLPPQAGPLRLQVLGVVHASTGAKLLAQRDACDGPGCSAANDVTELLLEPLPGSRLLRLQLSPQSRFNRLLPARTAQLRIQQRGGEWTWQRSSPSQGAPFPEAEPARVTLLARHGEPLFDQGQITPEALAMGAAPLVGLTSAHERSVAGMLGRLGQHGQGDVVAQLTLETEHQQLLQQVLHCIGGQGGQWEAATETCQIAPGTPLRDPRSITAATVMDARSGHLLAVTTGDVLPRGVQAAELLAFDHFNPQGSPLALHGLQHHGGPAHAPGSTFKLADAVSFELAAQGSAALRAWLVGLPMVQVDAQARAAGKPFALGAACYPAPCAAKTLQIQNFGLHAPEPASRYVNKGRFGLREALRHSVNTWFAMTAEWQDQTVALGHADARPLGQGALRESRPLLETLARLGFTEAQRLDGGLLPESFNWQTDDALLASASALGPNADVHAIRQQALGLRMQTTPLQMTRMAATLATGQVVKPQLLLELNGNAGLPRAGVPLGFELGRIQQAMQDTVAMGTAATAFKGSQLDAVRSLVHGKTGSAPLASRYDSLNCKGWPAHQPAPTACLHNAWFVGYLLPGALPGDERTLAFAVQISHTRGMGGSQAAPVVAAWLETLWARHAKPALPRQ